MADTTTRKLSAFAQAGADATARRSELDMPQVVGLQQQLEQLQHELRQCEQQGDLLAEQVRGVCGASQERALPAGTPPMLLDFFQPPGSSKVPDVQLQQLAEVADREQLLVNIYKFRELRAGQTLQAHVREQLENGTCAHPRDEKTLVHISQAIISTFGFASVDAVRKALCNYWKGHAAFNVSTFTPIHLTQEWQTYIKNVVNGNNESFVLRAVMPAAATNGKARLWNVVNTSCVLVDEDGRRHWCWIRQGWWGDSSPDLHWSLRDLHSTKLTLFCSTYCDFNTGVILSQNATPMATFGNHGVFNVAAGDRPRPNNPADHNFLEMLFEARKDELARLPEVVGQDVYRIDGLEIVNPTLRSWIGVKTDQAVFHDVQIVCNIDPVTQRTLYAISQIDCTERVLAQRQLQQALAELAEDKERLAALMRRQHDLIACLGKLNAMETAVRSSGGSTLTDTLDTMRRQIHQSSSAMMTSDSQGDEIKKLELLGAGTFGKVHRALWKGKTVAVKSVLLPLGMSANKKQEAMAVMEAAVSSSLTHPNIVQTYTYHLQPSRAHSSTRVPSQRDSRSSRSESRENLREDRHNSFDVQGAGSPDSEISGFEVQLVLELCDQGSLRQALDQKVFHTASGQLDYLAVLETAADIARGMQHLHSLNTWHSDLKANNTLLASADTRRGFTAKVSDFGLSLKVDADQASVSGSIQGTGPYIAPEVYTSGTRSAAADVYAFGITLWELLTAGEPLHTVPRVMLAQQVVVNHLRPTFPPGTPAPYMALAQRCWDPLPSARPTFDEVLSCLSQLLAEAPPCIPVPHMPGDSGDGFEKGFNDRTSLPLPALETPVQRMLSILDQLLLGETVDLKEVTKLHDAITCSRDVLQPTDLAQRMQTLRLDDEVSRSLLTLLSGMLPAEERRARLNLRLSAVTEDDEGSPIRRPPSRGASASRGQLSASALDDIMLGHDLLPMLRAPNDEVLAVLSTVDSWDFDPFLLEQATQGHPMSTLAFALLRRLDMGSTRGLLEERKLARFLLHIEDGYNDLPYHNRIHAAAVLHGTYAILTSGGVLHSAWTSGNDMVLLTALFSAIVHDYEHLGLNNDFLIKTKHQLALVYNDRSPMEQHHLAAAFTLVQQREYNFLSSMPDKVQATFRRQVIECVLATDMKQHFGILSLFNTKFGTPNGKSTGSAGSRPHSQRSAKSSMVAIPKDGAVGLDDDTLSLVLQTALKCADLSSLASPAPVHRAWAERLEQEYWIQGDRERDAGLPISPLMDRHCPKGGVTRSQTGFFAVVGLPLFQAFAGVFPDTAPMLQTVKENYKMWQDEGK